MAQGAGNYQSDIHNADYEAEYLESLADGRGLINTAGRPCESLNGQWNFVPDWYDTLRRAHWFRDIPVSPGGLALPCDWDWEAWERIPVPAVWNLERPELHYYESTGVYTRTFSYLPRDEGERLILRFEGVSYRASVFLNGAFVGSHDGASTPFNFDITALVKRNAAPENRIIVAADARRSPFRIPMDNTDWFNYGGIYRDVLLYRLPAVFIKDWFVRLAPGSGYGTILADVTMSDAAAAGRVRVDIPELGISRQAPLEDGRASFAIEARPGLWSPRAPKLYDVHIEFMPEGAGPGGNAGAASGAPGDRASDRIGFREIRAQGTDIFLNGVKIFLRGACVHEDHIRLGKTTNPGLIRAAIKDLKEMNGNYLRLAHYPHDGRFAKIADEEGVLLWEEVPVYWAVAFHNPATYADAENQLTELILRDHNRASVMSWSVGNENADTDERHAFMSALAGKARSLDDSRLVSAACLIDHEKLVIKDRLADSLDVIGINEYYGWYDPDFGKLPAILSNSNPGKPVVICEFGGGARAGQRGTIDDLWTEDKQRALYEQQVETFKRCPYIAGTTPWILYDFRCPRRLNRYQEHFNRKGLIDADRLTRKPAYDVMRRFYADIARGEEPPRPV
jgi:beta-glucuronidase